MEIENEWRMKKEKEWRMKKEKIMRAKKETKSLQCTIDFVFFYMVDWYVQKA